MAEPEPPAGPEGAPDAGAYRRSARTKPGQGDEEQRPEMQRRHRQRGQQAQRHQQAASRRQPPRAHCSRSDERHRRLWPRVLQLAERIAGPSRCQSCFSSWAGCRRQVADAQALDPPGIGVDHLELHAGGMCRSAPARHAAGELNTRPPRVSMSCSSSPRTGPTSSRTRRSAAGRRPAGCRPAGSRAWELPPRRARPRSRRRSPRPGPRS